MILSRNMRWWRHSGASMSPCGFLFDRVGAITVSLANTPLDDAMDLAIEVGAQDVVHGETDELFIFKTAPTELNLVAGRLKENGHELVCVHCREAEFIRSWHKSNSLKLNFNLLQRTNQQLTMRSKASWRASLRLSETMKMWQESLRTYNGQIGRYAFGYVKEELFKICLHFRVTQRLEIVKVDATRSQPFQSMSRNQFWI